MCDKCKDGKVFCYTSDVSIHWFQWEKQIWTDNKDQLQKVEKSGTFEQALQKLKMQIPSIVLHNYIKQKQSASYIEHKLQYKRSKWTVVLSHLF